MAKFFRLTLLACDPLRISSIHSRKIKTKHARPAATAADPTHVGHPHVFIQARDFLSTQLIQFHSPCFMHKIQVVYNQTLSLEYQIGQRFHMSFSLIQNSNQNKAANN